MKSWKRTSTLSVRGKNGGGKGGAQYAEFSSAVMGEEEKKCHGALA